MIDRRILLASLASLFGLAAFRWLRATPAQAKTPLRFSFSSGLEPGRSVPCLRRMSYCCGVSCARHSASVFSTSNFSAACAGVARSQRKAARPNRLATDASRIRRSIM